MDSLRHEIVESQKARTDLIKWKLIMIAALGGTGLGFTKSGSMPNAEYILCCIPIVCAYADLQCRNLSLRIFGLSNFLYTLSVKNTEKNYFYDYGVFLKEVRIKANKKGGLFCNKTLESLVIVGTSLLISSILLFYTVIQFEKSSITISFFSVGGILFSLWLAKNFEKRSSIIQEVREDRMVDKNKAN